MRSICVLVSAIGLSLAACDRVPTEARSEWSPRDHNGEAKSSKQGERQAANPEGASALGDLAWLNQCANCHGPGGAGNGPMGPSSGARDLTGAEFKPRATAANISSVIKNGKGRMPKFDVPDEVVEALVKKVQSFSR